jgi:hypothetical protein
MTAKSITYKRLFFDHFRLFIIYHTPYKKVGLD